MPKLRTSLIAALAAFVAAPAAAAQAYEPTFTRAAYWLHAHTAPLGNLDARQGNFVKWDKTKPTAPTPARYVGNNYASLVPPVPDHDPAHFLTMQGQVKGDIDNLVFDLFFNMPSRYAMSCPVNLSVELTIDGKEVIRQDYKGSNGFPYLPLDESSGHTQFAMTHIWDATQGRIAQGPDVVHDVYINLQNFYVCMEYVWLYDSALNPSGFVANDINPVDAGFFEFDVTNPPASYN